MIDNIGSYIFSKFFFLLKSLLTPLISFEIKSEQNNGLLEDGNVIYVLPENSLIENIALSICCEENKFVSPEESFSNSNIQRSISLRRPVFDNKERALPET